MTLTRDEILARRAELPRQTIDIPSLGGSVTIRTLTLKEMREINKLQEIGKGDPLSVYPRILAMAWVDENGQPIFVGEDVKLIEDLPWAATNAIATAVMKLTNPEAEGESPASGNGAPKA